MKRFAKCKQQDITDCGAACLSAVAAHHRLRIPLARMRQLAGTDRMGTNVLGLIEAAEKIGFVAKGVKGPFESLPRIPKPAIVHCIVRKTLHHFSVLYGFNKKHVILMDPADGKIHKLSHGEFKERWTGIMILLEPDEHFRAGGTKEKIARKFLRLLAPHKTVMLQALAGAVIYSLLGLATSFYVKNIIDHVLVDGNTNLLTLMSLIMILILLLRVYMGVMKGIFMVKTGQIIDARLILGYYRHLLTLPQRFFDTMRTGEIISRVNDAVKIRNFINTLSVDLVINSLIVFFTLSIMVFFSPKLALAVAGAIPLYLGVYLLFNRLNRKYLRRIMERAADLESQFVESLRGIATIKHTGAEEQAGRHTEARFVRLLNASYRQSKNSLLTVNASEFISSILTVGVLWLGSRLVLTQDITPGSLLSFYALTGYLVSPLSQLIGANQGIQDAIIAADRLFQILDLEQENAAPHRMVCSRDIVQDIRFSKVCFRYGTRSDVFRDLNLVIPARRMTALVGESGSGKSSIGALIQKLYPIQSGSIELGKYNLQHLETVSLRKLIGVVPQQIELFGGTVIENIAFGVSDPDVQRVMDVCAFLGIKDFIESLPEGFHTLLGEYGTNLSGGERQRIALARALYHDPEILILDEATSALDAKTELQILKGIAGLKNQGKTIIVISHRLHTIVHADKICVLSNGQPVEEGTHEELTKKNGYYSRMWHHSYPDINDPTRSISQIYIPAVE